MNGYVVRRMRLMAPEPDPAVPGDIAPDALLTVTTPANLTLAVKALSLVPLKRQHRVAVFVTFTDGSMVTLRIAEDRLAQLYTQLGKALRS